MDSATQQRLRELPAVDEAMRALAPRWQDTFARPLILEAVRRQIQRLRQRILSGAPGPDTLEPAAVERRLQELATPSLRPLLNATGVVVHTNLGRAPLPPEVLARVEQIASGYSNLEYELERRGRGSRHGHVVELLRGLTGAEDAVVVNNNAAAVLLCLATLAAGREVVVSRGELIEIGGSFRIPDVMASSGALLREVGTTNRTHPRDYEGAIGEQTALLLKAHTSNFAVVGFTREVDPLELVAIGRRHGVPTMYDLGSGCLLDLAPFGLGEETPVQRAVEQGFDLTTFSGDKLLGGPQAGLIVGRAELVARVRSHPLMRPLRPDKMTLAALTATLELYRDGAALSRVPVLTMIAATPEQIRARARRVRTRLNRRVGAPWRFDLVSLSSRAGGGSSPLAALPSFGLSVSCPDLGPDQVEALLRGGRPPVIGRIEEDRLVLDLRTVPEERLGELVDSMAGALGQAAFGGDV